MSKFKRIDLDDSYGGYSGYVQIEIENPDPHGLVVYPENQMATYTTPKPVCPHCKTGTWRRSLGIEFHSIGTFIKREAGNSREFQRLLDVSKFTERFNTFATHHGSEPTWHEQLRWIARGARQHSTFTVTFNEQTRLEGQQYYANVKLMERIHAERCIEGSVYELIEWACGDMVRIYPQAKRVTSDPCNVCGFNDPGDFTKWESVEQMHVMQDMGEEEIKIRFAAMRTFIERGFVAMVEQFWHVQDYLQEIGRYDHKMMMKADGTKLRFKVEQKNLMADYSYEVYYLRGQFQNDYQAERMYNYNWFLGIPPGRIIMQPGNTKNGIKIFLTRFHIPALRTSPFLVDIRAKPNGIFDYFDSSPS